MTKQTLEDIGELALLNDVVLPLAKQFDPDTPVGDDCTFIPASKGVLAVTADAGPAPLIRELEGFEEDYEAAGWLAAIATISDVASAGARPLLLTNCTDAPPDMPLDHFKNYLTGYFRALSEFGFRNGGGDVRQADRLGMRVFGVGQSVANPPIGRRGARAGDKLVGIGPMGEVMAAFLAARRGALPHSQQMEIIRFPRPQLRQMVALAEAGCVSAASDTSDGFLGAIDNIARSSQSGVQLELRDDMLSQSITKAAALSDVQPWNIYFCWGDWSIAAAIPAAKFELFEEVCGANRIDWICVGHLTDTKGRAEASLNGQKSCQFQYLRNENFRPLGYNAGLDGHLDHMLRTPIFGD